MKLTESHKVQIANAVVADLPTIDFKLLIEEAYFVWVYSVLPKPAQELWDKEATRCYLSQHCRDLSDGYTRGPGPTPLEKIPPALLKKLLRLEQDYSDQTSLRDSTRREVLAYLKPYNTTKAVAAAFPEFVRYLPPEPGKQDRTLPVPQGLVDRLKLVGWPKGKK